jgi:hypothetical protein
MAVRVSAVQASRPLLLRNIIFLLLLLYFCERLSKLQGLVRSEGLGKLKKKKKMFSSLAGLEDATFRIMLGPRLWVFRAVLGQESTSVLVASERGVVT